MLPEKLLLEPSESDEVWVSLLLKSLLRLVARVDKVLGLREPALARGEPKRRVNKVGRASMAVEVGDEFLGRHSFELGGEVGVVHRRSSGEARQLPWELDPRPRDLELEEAMLRSQL